MNHENLIFKINAPYRVFRSDSDFTADTVTDDLDLMLFEGHYHREDARVQVINIVTDYLDHDYKKDVKEFTENEMFTYKPTSLIGNDLYVYMRSFGRDAKTSLSMFRYLWDDDKCWDLMLCYNTMWHSLASGDKVSKWIFQPDPKIYEEIMLGWANYIKTELHNDGFDPAVIGKKLLDLIFTLACMDVISR